MMLAVELRRCWFGATTRTCPRPPAANFRTVTASEAAACLQCMWMVGGTGQMVEGSVAIRHGFNNDCSEGLVCTTDVSRGDSTKTSNTRSCYMIAPCIMRNC